MKKSLKYLLVFIITLALIWLLYNTFSYSKLPKTVSQQSTVGYFDKNYSDNILDAQSYLKTIPEKINVPSFSVAIGINGNIIWSEAIGFQNIEKNTIANPNTIYRIGSTSKAVTSTLIAKLYQEGLIDLDYLISEEIENYPKKKMEFHTKAITLSFCWYS